MLFRHIDDREKHARLSLLADTIDVFPYFLLATLFFLESFAFRSFVFAGSINIYIA